MNTNVNSVVGLTESAASHIKEMLAKEQASPNKGLRVYVEDGGCSGMQYGMVFDEQREGDDLVRQMGVTVLVDPFSAKYIRGAVVDYVDSLNDGGFKIANPNAKTSCGCGKSFESQAQ